MPLVALWVLISATSEAPSLAGVVPYHEVGHSAICPVPGIVVGLAMTTHHFPARPPTAYARRRLDGSWYADVTWQNGRREHTGNYKSATEAEDDIRQMLEAWHDGQVHTG